MHKIINYVNMLNEIEGVSNVVGQKGQDVLASGAVRDKVSRLLTVHRHMTTPPKPPNKRAPTPKPTPPILMDNLREFRAYLENKLTESHLSVSEAEDMAAWAAECKRMMNRVNVHVLGLGITRSSGDELKSSGKALVARGRKLMMRKGCGRRLPRSVYFGVKRRVEDLKDSLKYVDNKPQRLTVKLGGTHHNMAAVLNPVNVENEDPFKGIKEPRVRKFKCRLSRRKRTVSV